MKSIQRLFVLTSSILATAAWAGSTPVAVVAGVPELNTLSACITARAQVSGPVLSSERLLDGLEFRLRLHAVPDAPSLLVVSAFLKPDVAGLITAHDHDDDPEAQSAAATRFYRLLRIPLGSRAWRWQAEREQAICGEAAAWIERVRSRPVNFDHIGVDGDYDGL